MTRAGRRSTRRRRAVAVGLSLAAHLALVLALISVRPTRLSPPQQAAAMTLALVQAPALVRPAPSAPQPSVAKASPPPRLWRPTPVRADRDAQPVQAEAAQGVAGLGVAGLSEGELQGAATAGSGAPGGACDMVRRLQAALRKDALVQAAATSVGQGSGQGLGGAGKAVLVWNGDWVATPGQDGKGLAAVREAILWEVGFAPEACRKTAVHGLVLLSLSDTPGVARLVLGGGDWRWSDLLTPRTLGAAAR